MSFNIGIVVVGVESRVVGELVRGRADDFGSTLDVGESLDELGGLVVRDDCLFGLGNDVDTVVQLGDVDVVVSHVQVASSAVHLLILYIILLI